MHSQKTNGSLNLTLSSKLFIRRPLKGTIRVKPPEEWQEGRGVVENRIPDILKGLNRARSIESEELSVLLISEWIYSVFPVSQKNQERLKW